MSVKKRKTDIVIGINKMHKFMDNCAPTRGRKEIRIRGEGEREREREILK